MADYYPLLARALDGLAENTRDARSAVYERAKAALLGQLRAVNPPLDAAAIAREQASLEEAITKAERSYGASRPKLEDEPPKTDDHAEPGSGREQRNGPPIRRGGKKGRSLLTAFGLVAVIVPIAVAAWFLRDQPAQQVPAEAPPTGQPAQPNPNTDPKFPERVGGSTPAGPAPRSDRPVASPSTGTPPTGAPGQDVVVAQKAALVEENSQDPQNPKVTPGRALWRLDATNAGRGQPLETVVRATIDVPDAGVTLQLAMRRNKDATLPASHTIELTFTTLPASDTSRFVRDVNPPLFRADDGARGVPVAALSVPVKENLFLIGLSDLRGDLERNSDLIQNRNWVELPVRFASGTRATLIFEKGVTGGRVIADAYKAWAQP